MPRITPAVPPVVVVPFSAPTQIKLECPCCHTSLVIRGGLQLDVLDVKIVPKPRQPLRSPSRRGSGPKRRRTDTDDSRGRLPDADGQEADDEDGRPPMMMSGAAAELPPADDAPAGWASPPCSPAKRRRTGAADEKEEEDEADDEEEPVIAAEPRRGAIITVPLETSESEESALPMHLLPRGGPRSDPAAE